MDQPDSTYGAYPLHFAVWRGNAERTRELLNMKADPNVADRDGQTPWAWAEAKQNEAMMEILGEYGGAPLPVWSIKVEPNPDDIVLSCTNIAGEIVCHARFRKDVPVRDVCTRIARESGKAATLVLPNNHILDLSNYDLPLEKLLDSPPSMETRKNPKDGRSYTKQQFFKYYGMRKGQAMWNIAVPDKNEVELACAQSLRESVDLENQMLSAAIFRSLHECDGGENHDTIVAQNSSACLGKLKTNGAFSMPASNALCKPGVLDLLVIEVSRTPRDLHQNLMQDDALKPCIQALLSHGFLPILPNGAHIFVRPDWFEAVAEEPQIMALRPWHVVVEEELEDLVVKVIRSLPKREQVREKRRATRSISCGTWCHQHKSQMQTRCHRHKSQVHIPALSWDLVVSRTFIHIKMPSSLRSEPTSRQTASTTDAHLGPSANVRRR